MKKLALVVGVLVSLAIGQVAQAVPVTSTYADKELNWATWTTSPSNINNTLEGTQITPDIKSTSITLDTGNQLEKVVFNLNSYNFNVGSGDLFIDANNDQTWDYVVRALDQSLNTPVSTALGLYSINVGLHETAAYAMSYYNSNLYSYRPGLPIGLKNTPDANKMADVAYTANKTSIAFDFGAYSPLFFDQDFVIGYAVTCGNDVVYQEVPVPEPGTMALLGFGLLGLVVYGKRRMGKSA